MAGASLMATAPFISRHSWAAGSPMQKLQYAGIGVGGRGAYDINSISGHKKVHMVAAADVDSDARKKLAAKAIGVKIFSDWREMLQATDIDIVSVSTPDHMHGIMALSAMNMGKHVYVQKPLAQTGKPILLCDFAIRFRDGDKDIRSWKPAADSVAAGKSYSEYVKATLDTDYIVGVFWCNPVDTPKGFGKPGVKQGFFGKDLTERPGLHDSVKRLNAYRDKVTPKR